MTQTWTRAKVPRLFLESLIPNLQNPIPETLNPKITIPRHKTPYPELAQASHGSLLTCWLVKTSRKQGPKYPDTPRALTQAASRCRCRLFAVFLASQSSYSKEQP